MSSNNKQQKTKTSVDEKIANVIDIEIVEEDEDDSTTNIIKHTNKQISVDENEDESIREDTDFALRNLRRLAILAEQSFQSASAVAEESENARSYEVASQLLKTAIEANDKILDVHKKSKETRNIGKPTKESAPTGNTNIEKAIFVGTPADLQKQLKQKTDD